ncbi:MAG: hypothetical protein FJY47_01450 [Betaproteobacteria bacterium]|nr:hypothetical protein [Betaproteobacteria bacterium]
MERECFAVSRQAWVAHLQLSPPDNRLRRKVAIKTKLKSALESDSAREYWTRLRCEAQAVARRAL